MGLYSRFLFPLGYDRLVKMEQLDRRRVAHLAGARGEVLEIGIGTGLNLPHWPEDMTRLTAVEPNRGMHRQLARKLSHAPVGVHAVPAVAERLPFRAGSFDTVVTTLVLCSLPDLAESLAEVRRVLRPDGRFLFLEHGASPDPGVARWQRRLNWIQGKIGDGCRLDLPVEHAIQRAGFVIRRLDRYYLEKGPRTHSYMYDGEATPG